MIRAHRPIAAAIVAGVVAAIPLYFAFRQPEPLVMPDVPPAQRVVMLRYEIEMPSLEPEPPAVEPTLTDEAEEQISRRVSALAAELSRMWTKSPERLVDVIERASRRSENSPPVTLLLAIAHAETNGKILDVSEAGAVGLAQATPVAYRQEKFKGKLFVTSDYLLGARAYIVKKPLGDAYKIATVALESRSGGLKKAKKLLKAAKSLRREGLDELEYLRPYARARYFDVIENADRHNKAVLAELERLLNANDRDALRDFRDRIHDEYSDLRREQIRTWKRYQNELIAERDALLMARFGATFRTIDEDDVYEASEYLAEHLDERFSAKAMAAFLVQHLERKTVEARKLTRVESRVESMTAALYNGGSHNVKRMLVGLISTLPETDKYAKKVPATRRRLDATVARVEMGGPLPRTMIRTLR